MKLLKLIVSVSLAVIGSMVVYAGIANAQSDKSIVGNPTVDKSVYIAGNSVYISGTINGDIYCAGQNVDISATVHGDVICAAQDVNVSGKVDGSVRLVAENATVDAAVGHSVSIAAETASLGFKASVGQDFSAFAQDVDIEGNVGRDLTARASSLTLDGNVSRNVQYYGTDLTLDNGSKIGGDLSYTSPQTAVYQGSSKVTGHTYYTQQAQQSSTFKMALRAEISSFIFAILAFLLFAILTILVAPKAINDISETAASNLGKAAFVGFVATIVIPVVSFILLFTVIGIPVAIFLFVSWSLLWMFGMVSSGFYLGKLVAQNNHNAFIIVTVGCALLLALIYVPILGFFVGLAAYLIGSGAILLTARKHLADPDYHIK